MKEYTVKLIQHESGRWSAKTPKTCGRGAQASSALHDLADKLDVKETVRRLENIQQSFAEVMAKREGR